MSTSASAKTPATKKWLLAAIVALLLAVGGGVFAISQALADEPVFEPEEVVIVDNMRFFDTKLDLDTTVSTTGFNVQVVGTYDYEFRYLTPMSREEKKAKLIEAGMSDAEAEAELANWEFNVGPDTDKTGRGEFWRGRLFSQRYNRFEDEDVYALRFGKNSAEDGAAAAKDAKIIITYPVIGSYFDPNYVDPITGEQGGLRPVGMRVTISDIDYHLSALRTRPDGGIYGATDRPTYQIGARPTAGIHQFNVNSAAQTMELYYADVQGDKINGSDALVELLEADDVYVTSSSLSTWDYRDFHISEKVKALSPIEKVYMIKDTNISENPGPAQYYDPDSTDGKISDNPSDQGYWYGYVGEDWRKPSAWNQNHGIDVGNEANHYDDRIGISNFTKNAVSFKFEDSSNMKYKTLSTSDSMWFTLYPQALTSKTPNAPKKSDQTGSIKGVYGEDDEIPEAAAVAKPGDIVKYTIDQQVNQLGVNSIAPYASFVITDEVPAHTTLVSASFVDEAGNSLPAEAGSLKYLDASGAEVGAAGAAKVVYEFNPSWMESNAAAGNFMTGEHYFMKLEVQVDDDVQSGQDVENHVTTNVNRKTLESDEVITQVIGDEDLDDELHLTARDEVFTFTVSMRVPADATEITLTDALEYPFEIVDTEDPETGEAIPGVTLSANGTTINPIEGESTDSEVEPGFIRIESAEGDAGNGQTKTTVTATIKDGTNDIQKYVTQLRGQMVTLTINAKLKDSVSDEQLLADYGDPAAIPNTGTVTFGNETDTSNKVVVVPPDTPEKEVGVDAENQSKELLELDARDQVYTYTIKQRIPGDAEKVTFEDTLEDVLEVISAEMQGSKVAYDIQQDGQKVTATYTYPAVQRGEDGSIIPDEATDRGEIITLVIKAKIKDTVKGEELIEKYGDHNAENSLPSTAIPNKATVSIDDRPLVTNEVNVIPPETPGEKPEKKVNGENALTLNSRVDTFNYTISQQLPDDVKAVTFTDTLESVLEVDESSIKVEGAQTKFETSVDGQTITAIAEDASADAGQTITLSFTANIKAGVTDEQLVTLYGEKMDIPNFAIVTINDNPRVTNTVTVTPPPSITEEPEKKVNNADQYSLANRDEVFTYTVSQKIPDGAINVVLSDKLESVLEPVKCSINVEGITPEVSGQTVTATIEDASGLYGQTVVLTIEAKIKDGVTDEALIAQYGEAMDIPNTATVTIDGTPRATNEVLVNPPTPEPPTPAEEPVKKVNDAEKAELKNRADEFVYTIDQVIPANAVNVVFSDTLERVLQPVECTINVEGITPVVDGQTVTATIDDATGLAGQTVTLTIKAVIKEGVTDAQLITLYGSTDVPNEATVSIDGNPQVSNEVLVTPPPEEPPTPDQPNIQKQVETTLTTINNLHGDLAAIDDVFVYTIDTAMPTNAKGFEVTDTIDSVLAFEGDVAIVVDGKAAGTATKAGQLLTVTFTEDEVAENAGKAIQIKFAAKIAVSDEELVAKYADRTVPNTAQYTITDLSGQKQEPKPSNTVTVTPPTPETPVGSVIVQHVTEDGTVLRDWADVVRDVPAGTSYTTSEGTFPGYELVKVNDAEGYAEATGKTIAPGELKVQYIYRPIGSVIVQHVTEDGTVLRDWADVVRDVPAGTDYTTSEGTFAGYELVKVNDAEGYAEATGKTIAPGELKVQYIYKPITPEPTKAINGGTDPVSLAKAEDSFTYTVTSLIPGGSKKVVITDTIEDVLEVVGTPVCSAPNAKVEVNGQTITATIDDASALAGLNVTLTFTAQIKDGVTKEQLIQKYGETLSIPNKATFTFDDNPYDTNEVLVNPPLTFEEVNRNPNTPNPENPETPGTDDKEEPKSPNTPSTDNPTPTVKTTTPTTTTTPSTTTSVPRGTTSTAKTGDDVTTAAGLLVLAAAAGLAGMTLALRRRRQEDED